jgi:NAD(P)H dehydrogenase (quinone)
VLVAYYSKTGATEKMARAVDAGAKSVAGTTVIVKAIDQVSDKDLLDADAIVVGSPVYNGGMAGAVKQFIERWPFGKLKDKVGAAFCAGGGASAGEELTLMNIISSMLIFQFVIVGGESWQAAFGASAITEEGKPQERRGVDEAALAKARGLGARVARVAAKLAAR